MTAAAPPGSASLSFDTPIGPVTLTAEDGALTALAWGGTGARDAIPPLVAAREMLEAYFAGGTPSFADLPLAPRGTSFQRRVWAALAAIPYGTTLTYGDLARRLGSAARAVGGACGRNPLPLIIPCHRVVGRGGALGGYSGVGGVATKRRLLDLEGVRLPAPR